MRKRQAPNRKQVIVLPFGTQANEIESWRHYNPGDDVIVAPKPSGGYARRFDAEEYYRDMRRKK